MNYLVTGGAGFIGANFVKYLLKKYRNIQIIVLDDLTYAGNLRTIKNNLEDLRLIFIKGNIKDPIVTDDIFSKYPVRFVVNFAAESHVDRSIKNPQIFLETNILGTQNLLEISKKHWMTGEDENGYPTYKEGVKYLQISTDEVYGSLGKTGYFTEKTPLDPHSPYGASKTGADLIVKAYGETYKMPVNITRCSNNYGPYHFPEKLIPLMIKNILEGKKLPVYGDGNNVRDWLYVEDHCKAIDLVLSNGRLGEIYNIGGHNEKKNIDVVRLTIATIRHLIEENPMYRKALKKNIYHCGSSSQSPDYSLNWINDDLITYVKDRLGHDQRYAIDSTKITTELGWYPETTFEDGIKKTICWYLENQDWMEEVMSNSYEEI